jgi:hypothetical protein
VEEKMKKIIVLIAGLTPFLIGYGLNLLLYKLSTNFATVSFAISVMFFLYWGLLGFTFSKFTSSKIYTLAICHFPALLVLLLILIQELINKRYWNNILGFATQFFYLPTITVSSKITGYLSVSKMWETYIISFGLMIAVFYLGCYIRDKRQSVK